MESNPPKIRKFFVTKFIEFFDNSDIIKTFFLSLFSKKHGKDIAGDKNEAKSSYRRSDF